MIVVVWIYDNDMFMCSLCCKMIREMMIMNEWTMPRGCWENEIGTWWW